MKMRSIGLEKVSSPPKWRAAIKGAKVLCSIAAPSAMLVSIDRYQTGFPKLNPLIKFKVTVLFAGSIADNISFFDAQADVAWVQQCARLASVHDEIEAMPMGYDTLVGEMGASISGGQKQRILLARALYKRPQILLLDEATSALDVDRERLVNQAVKQLQLTRIIVAHRPETLASASRVIMLHEGRVAHDLRSVATGR